MKTILLSMLLMSSTVQIFNQKPTLRNEISEKMILDLIQVELHENFQDYVVVHFSMCDNEITVESIEGTHSEVGVMGTMNSYHSLFYSLTVST
ncbi:MAG: hypothetical protein R2799_06800 [Crocinitomicaceae bacterium]